MTNTTITFKLNQVRTLVGSDGSETTFEYTDNARGHRGRTVLISYYCTIDGMKHHPHCIGTAKEIWNTMVGHGSKEDTRFTGMAA